MPAATSSAISMPVLAAQQGADGHEERRHGGHEDGGAHEIHRLTSPCARDVLSGKRVAAYMWCDRPCLAQGGGFAPEKDFDMSEPENRPLEPPADAANPGRRLRASPRGPSRRKPGGRWPRRRSAGRRREDAQAQAPKEIDGRGGLDPVRYGDWEIKGLTSDF